MTLTPEQFNKLATKDDLKKFKEELKEEFASKEQSNKIIEMLDGITKSFKDHEEEHDMNKAAHRRFERRISKLEGKPVEAIEII